MSPTRFFFVIAGPTPVFCVVAGGVVAFGVYLAALGIDGFNPAFGTALFLQLFAASTGYRDRLRRGHFDPILVARSSSIAIAAAHWLVSVGLGTVVWLAIVLTDVVSRTTLHGGLSAAGVAVLLYSSTVVWAISLPLGRYAGGVLWLIALFVLGSTHQLQALREWSNVGAALACPVILLGNLSASRTEVAALAAGAVVAWSSGALAIRWFQAVLVEA